MITLRLAVLAILAAAVAAAALTYFVTPPASVEAEQPLEPTMFPSTFPPDARASASLGVDRQPNKEEKSATAYQLAAEAILRRAQNAQADARPQVPPANQRVPLPRKRPLTWP